MSGIGVFLLNMLCYIHDIRVKIFPEKGFTDLGGCINFTISISNKKCARIMKSILYDQTNLTHIDLYGDKSPQSYDPKQTFLLNYIHSFDKKWVALCDINSKAEGIHIGFVVSTEFGIRTYHSDGIKPDYCDVSKRCNSLYLQRNEKFLPEISKLTNFDKDVTIHFKETGVPMASNIKLFAVCRYNGCFTSWGTKSYYEIIIDETKITFSVMTDQIDIVKNAYTMNNYSILIIYDEQSKISIIKTTLHCEDRLFSDPVEEPNSLTFNFTDATITKVAYIGKVYFDKSTEDISCTEYLGNRIIVTFSTPPEATFAAIIIYFSVEWPPFRAQEIPIYMIIKRRVNVSIKLPWYRKTIQWIKDHISPRKKVSVTMPISCGKYDIVK